MRPLPSIIIPCLLFAPTAAIMPPPPTPPQAPTRHAHLRALLASPIPKDSAFDHLAECRGRTYFQFTHDLSAIKPFLDQAADVHAKEQDRLTAMGILKGADYLPRPFHTLLRDSNSAV